MRIVVCQGESRRLDNNIVLGDLRLENLPPRPRGETVDRGDVPCSTRPASCRSARAMRRPARSSARRSISSARCRRPMSTRRATAAAAAPLATRALFGIAGLLRRAFAGAAFLSSLASAFALLAASASHHGILIAFFSASVFASITASSPRRVAAQQHEQALAAQRPRSRRSGGPKPSSTLALHLSVTLSPSCQYASSSSALHGELGRPCGRAWCACRCRPRRSSASPCPARRAPTRVLSRTENEPLIRRDRLLVLAAERR